MMERERIGTKLREARKSLGYSQEYVAEKAGIGRGHIVRIEQGKYSVTIDTLSKILNVLGKEIDFPDKISRDEGM
ncbi:MAG: helix-turn-helix transcriptional regulator [Dysgonamonadaceae bacterium]|jgi:transcriptional regulator with XRE-family HTH domain|nr:helix-turn-helix transcriptional regulator [Dysgonamonadaceae bacterium]